MSRNPRRFDYERDNMREYERQFQLDLAAAERADAVRSMHVRRIAAERRRLEREARAAARPVGLAQLLGHHYTPAQLHAEYMRESIFAERMRQMHEDRVRERAESMRDVSDPRSPKYIPRLTR